jgi:hypothetical protein
MPAKKMEPVKVDKIVKTLGVEGEEKKMYNRQPLLFDEKDRYAPTLVEPAVVSTPEIVVSQAEINEIKEEQTVRFELYVDEKIEEAKEVEKTEDISDVLTMRYEEKLIEQKNISSDGFLNKPANIYAQTSLQPEPVKHDDMPIEKKKEEPVKKKNR